MSRARSILVLLAVSCAVGLSGDTPSSAEGASEIDFEKAPSASPRLADDRVEAAIDIATRIDSHFERSGTGRMHVQLDRPLYRPGETVWLKTWLVGSFDFGVRGGATVTYELLNPRGQVVATKRVAQGPGQGTNDFVLPADAPGGSWTLRATATSGEVDERPFVVASYQAPRVRKHLEFVRQAYGPGDVVEALVELETPTGEPLAERDVTVRLSVDGEVVVETGLRTDRDGAVLATGELPRSLRTGDGLLTVLVEEGGVTESISRSVPIVLAQASLDFFPEGGELVAGLPGRVYFEAKNTHGEPADVAGYVVDDRGRKVTDFASLHDGLGRLAFTPQPGRTYAAHITSLPGLDAAFPLPVARTDGCTLRSYDDFASQAADVRVAVRCATPQDVVVTGVLRERTLDAAAVRAGPDEDAVVYLTPDPSRADQQGAVRVTVFDPDLVPLAERLVYRNHGRNLRIELTTDQLTYGPRDEVVLDVTTRDPSGDPVPAEIALSVVDDAVLSYADDENGHMLSRLYLAPEVVDTPDDPAWYFDPDEADAARAMDLVMGTRGYRRFEWAPVWTPPRPQRSVNTTSGGLGTTSSTRNEGLRMPAFADPLERAEPQPDEVGELLFYEDEEQVAPGPSADPAPVDAAPPQAFRRQAAKALEEREIAAGEAPLLDDIDMDMLEAADVAAHPGAVGRGMGRLAARKDMAWAPVRVFPAPDYRKGLTGVRSDFRDTVHWAPSVQTGAKGTAQVRFYLSDAVTSFRITAEGLGGDHAGHAETTLQSVLPVSLATRLPSAVSVGDRLMLPITASSTRDGDLDVTVQAELDGQSLRFAEGARAEQSLRLGSKASDTVFVPVEVGSGRETAKVRLTATGGGLSDTVERDLKVVPAGFPQTWSVSGSDASDGQRYVVELSDVVPDSLTATATWQPSPVSTLITGMEGLIRTPGGCFEQTSSTNWPNVAILNYLDAHDGDPRLKVRSAQALQTGYDRLTGYQIDQGGFETFGNGPGKEALSAFGLLQFTDMARVHPVDAKVIERDVTFLKSSRDGQGGFKKTGESAHGYGSAPKDVLDAFITYALVETGHAGGFEREIARQAEEARTTSDPYVLALATRTLLKAGHRDGRVGLERLVALQAEDGSFPGAKSSITRSYEANLLVESTALGALALMEGGRLSEAGRSVEWLAANRRGGTWGATQATALALAALTEHAERSRVPRSSGAVRIVVNGEVGGTLRYDAEDRDALVLDDWAHLLRTGRNVVELVQLSGEPLPYSLDLEWASVTPLSAPGAELALSTRLASEQVRLGDTVRLTARVDNRLDRVVPSPIARIGLPAGLEARTWQLEQLQERGQIAFFETREREVTLYWEGIHPNAAHEVALDLVATVPGSFSAPASSAYPYYNDDEKAWAKGSQVQIAVR